MNRVQSLWSPKKRETHTFYCPNCRLERKVPGRPSPYRAIHIARVALASAALTIALYPWLAWKGIVSILPLWIAFEVVYRLRFRAYVGCPHCGFDPYLYLTDVKRARQEVEDYWRRVFKEKGVPFPGDPLPEPVSQEKAEHDPLLDEDSNSLTQ